MGKYKYTREDVLDRREVEEMIERAPERVPVGLVPQVRAFLALLYLTGARGVEITQMRAGDLEIGEDHLTARIPTAKKRKRVGPLSHSWRVLKIQVTPANQRLVEAVRSYAEGLDPSVQLFRFSRTGRYVSERVTIWKLIKALNPSCSSHLFRHSRLTRLAMRGATGPELMAWAGHADLRPVGTYLHLAGRGLERLAGKVD